MEKSLEERLHRAVVAEDLEAVSQILAQGANPNKTTSQGKTSLGEAAYLGNSEILKLLIENSTTITPKPFSTTGRRRQSKSHKRKLRHDSKHSETVAKYKSLNDRAIKDYFVGQNDCTTSTKRAMTKSDKNQGYFVFIHSEGSSSDESRVATLKSPLSPLSLTPSPLGDLEWDEEIGNVAPTTSEDETWSSMYKWYAAILECTGAALASATMVSYGIDQQDAFMRTALHYATEQGHFGAANALVNAGCKVDIAAGDGLIPLHVAVIRDQGDIVKLLLSKGSHVNYKTHEKMTPLHFAASRGYLDLVKVLVSNGGYLEARDTNERTALYLAAGRGHSDIVKYLISVGANVNGEEIHGYTPLCEAVWQRYPSVVEVLLQSGARITHSHKLLHNAIIQRQEEIVKMLSNLGGGINLHNDNGDTPLLLASRLSQPKIARILLEKGANVNGCNSITGANALHIAVEAVDVPEEFEELLICLVEFNINMNTTALTGDTALNRALLLQKDPAAIVLIRYGADVNTCDLNSRGLDNLSIAGRRSTPNLARLLLKAGHYCQRPDSQSNAHKQGSTALWIYNACREPLSLSDYCRIKIRSLCKGKVLFLYVSSLPLPQSVKRFLMMEHEGYCV